MVELIETQAWAQVELGSLEKTDSCFEHSFFKIW